MHDYAIVRQPESNKLIGINLAKNGKREWVYPPFDESAERKPARQAVQNRNRSPAANTRESELKQRIWEDNIFGQVSSDGRQVYVIDELEHRADHRTSISPPSALAARHAHSRIPSATKPHNLLVALDLAKQGYQVWAVGGTTGDNPALAGAFFLGAPLPVGDQVYALAEFSGEIRLVCLDSRTGGLEWKQPLAKIEEQYNHERSQPATGRRVAFAGRRHFGLSDVGGRGGRRRSDDPHAPLGLSISRAATYRNTTPRRGFRSRVIGHQTCTAMATGSMRPPRSPTAASFSRRPNRSSSIASICLRARPAGRRFARDEMLFVACIHKGKIILVGRNRLKAINLADGKPAWKNELKLESEVTVGRGYYSDSFYYLPTSGQQICKIDLDTGTIVGRAQTEVELGNLVCYKDQLISVSPQSVASFVLLSEHWNSSFKSDWLPTRKTSTPWP